jgi:serine/threonine protein phosphatase 1
MMEATIHRISLSNAARSSMPPRVIAIGDIHGCAIALRALLESIQPQPADTVITLGDCVDRGPDSRDVIEQLLELRQRCHLVPLLGNHEEMMLNFLDRRAQPDNWLECGGQATLESYRNSEQDTGAAGQIPDRHVEFIRSWINFHEEKSHFFVHGGYEPNQPLAGQRWNVLRWHSLRNAVPPPHASGKTAVVGHTSQKTGEVLNLGYLICIDTYCYGGGWLTAYDLATDGFWQVDRRGRSRS